MKWKSGALPEAYAYTRRLFSGRGYIFPWQPLHELDGTLCQLTLVALDDCIAVSRWSTGSATEAEGPTLPVHAMLRWQNTVDRTIYSALADEWGRGPIADTTFEDLQLPLTAAELADDKESDIASKRPGAALHVQDYRRYFAMVFARFWVVLSVRLLQEFPAAAGGYAPDLLNPLLDFLQPDEIFLNEDDWVE